MSRAEGNPKPQYANVPADKKTAAYSKAYYEKNKEQRRADGKVQAAAYRKNNREKVNTAKRDQWLVLNFKRTSEWYNETLASQGGHCALCETVPEVRRFQVDHDHICCSTSRGGSRKTCGKCVRGLLCEGCNTRLGYLEHTMHDCYYGFTKAQPGTWTSLALRYLKQYEKPQGFPYGLPLEMPGRPYIITNVQVPSV